MESEVEVGGEIEYFVIKISIFSIHHTTLDRVSRGEEEEGAGRDRICGKSRTSVGKMMTFHT